MLEIKNMTVSYREKAVLENLSASFEKGRLVSIVGVNGAGKSTLLKLLNWPVRLRKNKRSVL